MIPDHIPSTNDYPGLIRFRVGARSFTALGDPAIHADTVASEIGALVNGTDPAIEGSAPLAEPET